MFSTSTIRRIGVGAAVFVAMTGLVAGLAMAGAAADSAQSTANTLQNETTQDREIEDCEAGLENIDLHTADDTITSDEPGRVSGAVATSLTNECPVEVQITFDIPNNMYFQGTSGVESSGQGLQTGTFTIEPGEVQDLSATIYGNQPGQHTAVANVEYFPEGQPEKAQSAGGYMLNFNVEEPSEDFDPETGETPDEPDEPPVKLPLLGIVGITVVGLLGIVWKKTNVTAIFRQK